MGVEAAAGETPSLTGEISEGERTLLVIIIMILINIIIVSLPTLDPVSFHLTFLTTL